MKLKHWLKVGRAALASTARGWQGVFVTHAAKQPEKRLKLYEFEACPYCRLVREVLTELHLDVEVYPCPKGGLRYRQEVLAIGGKQQFPFFIDPNHDVTLYESQAIIDYLYAQYGQRSLPWRHRLGRLQMLSSFGNTVLGGTRGMQARQSLLPAQPLTLYGFEASPFCRPVRETLCELELPYVLVNLGREQLADIGYNGMHATLGEYQPKVGGKREQFMNKTQRMMLPYLEDPNTGKGLFESAAIVQYLESTYGPA